MSGPDVADADGAAPGVFAWRPPAGAGRRAVRPAGGAIVTTRPTTRRWRCGRDGLLATFNRAGILSAADVHVARRLGAIGGETDERRAARRRAGRAVDAARLGVLDLATAEETTSPRTSTTTAIAPWPESPLDWPARLGGAVRGQRRGAGRPPAADGRLAALARRYWGQEEQVAAELLRPAGAPTGRPRPRRAGRRARRGCSRRRPTTTSGRPPQLPCASRGERARRRAGHRQDDDGEPACSPLLREQRPGLAVALAAPTGKAAARLEEAVQRRRSTLPRRGPAAARRAAGHDAAPAARLAARRAQPVPARPHQPAAGRRRRRRRDLDGVADDDGAAARGAAAGDPAGARRRPRPARLRRGRRGARRPGRPRCPAASSALDARAPLRTRPIARRWRRRSGAATPTPRSRCCAPPTSTGRWWRPTTTGLIARRARRPTGDVEASGRALVATPRSAGDAAAALQALGRAPAAVAHRRGPAAWSTGPPPPRRWVGDEHRVARRRGR